jgi:hypothetical protein
MCRSSAQGGRRCTGTTGTSTDTTGTTNSAPLIVLVDEFAEVNERARVDELARQLPADRKDAFGQRLDDKSRRFFALRESGYDGPIDQDGYPDTTSESADILRDMAARRGESVSW